MRKIVDSYRTVFGPGLGAASLLTFTLLVAACDSTPEVPGGGNAGTGGGTGQGDGDGDGNGDGDGDISLGGDSGTGGSGDGDGDASECGNGILEDLEICDDGNTNDADGCSGDCTEQDPDYVCLEPGEPCENTVICGNGVLEGDEVCDDGGESGGDGCSADCSTVEDGFQCPRPGKECVAVPVCGNGERERGEQCDDGEETPDDGDGCDSMCQSEEGFFCPVAGQACIALECGDGNRTPDEACDDGQMPPENGDGCSSTCTVESGFRCSATSCSPVCGDSQLVLDEECDDGNRISGDGCSAACVEEPLFTCTGAGPDSCDPKVFECGNMIVDPGEICDPPGEDGCLAGCKSFSPEVGGGSECGNNIIEAGEECDAPDPGNGCTAGCVEEPGWTCIRPNDCIEDPRCGDGVLHSPLEEACDDGNSTPDDGCDNDCGVNPGFTCYGLAPSVCVEEVCGDSVRTPGEQCEDNNTDDDDGCTDCVIDDGWACPTPGEDCIERCGDGVIVGDEECDDDNTDSGDGCNKGCRIEPGFGCTGDGPGSCTESECGDNQTDPTEGCDDGNSIAGDGCGPTCQLEPEITPGTDPTVNVFCGDGLITSGEGCDDGNAEPGDGCDDNCQEEDFFECEELLSLPPEIEMVVTYRDFLVAAADGGHPDFNYAYGGQTDGIAGAACTTAMNVAGTCGKLDGDGKPVGNETVLGTTMDEDQVGDDPDDHGASRIRSPGSFATWYRDSVGGSGSDQDDNILGYEGYEGVVQVRTIPSTLTLERDGTTDAYVFNSDDADGYNGLFNPLDFLAGDFGPSRTDPGGSCAGGTAVISRTQRWEGNLECHVSDANFSFTTELRYYFQYTGGESLTFRGDDDVWVFINGRLAVDIGGMHQPEYGRVVLGDDGWIGDALNAAGSASGQVDGNCSLHGGDTLTDLGTIPRADGCYTNTEHADSFDSRFGLEKGEVYEIVLFHAERHSTGSNFRLTLDGFLAPRSYCTPICGDGEVMPGEVCDDGDTGNGNSDDDNFGNDQTGECNENCSQRAYCGDGQLNIGETCDNGINLDLYLTGSDPTACAPGCVAPPTCGDGTVQAAFESCDNGDDNDDNSYGADSCTTDCGFGGYCGDGIENGPDETCDKGANNGIEYGPGSCGYDCLAGPRCGDNIRNGAEECDGTANCNEDCTYDPFCGDGVPSVGEECDWGNFASEEYGACNDQCDWGPDCGDGAIESQFEECDDAEANDDELYNGCTEACVLGPRCGDAVLQSDEDEECDNGFNDDTYKFTDTSCGANCTEPPSCGDGVVQSSYEFCDEGQNNSDTAYDGCTESCDWGPYCGDGTKDPEETCDDGGDNTAYSSDGEACGYDCEPAPYCGDGERNGPEQCDEGDDNTGEYGGCNENCTRAPYCGDGITQEDEGEDCDPGASGSLECTALCKPRNVVK